jgi:adenylosuccinate synthase
MLFDNHKAYPYCTSRNVDPLSFGGMTGMPSRMIGNILLNLRAHPIRVGDGSNTEKDGYSGVDLRTSNSGPCWPDQVELDWQKDLGIVTPEMTSLTKRQRRIFSFSTLQLKHITKIVQPTHITLNFVNYLDPTIAGATGRMAKHILWEKHPEVHRLLRLIETEQYWAETTWGAKVVLLGTGPKMSDYLELF